MCSHSWMRTLQVRSLLCNGGPHAATLEYLSLSPSRFRGYQLAIQTHTNQTRYIVVDKRFLNADDHDFVLYWRDVENLS